MEIIEDIGKLAALAFLNYVIYAITINVPFNEIIDIIVNEVVNDKFWKNLPYEFKVIGIILFCIIALVFIIITFGIIIAGVVHGYKFLNKYGQYCNLLNYGLV